MALFFAPVVKVIHQPRLNLFNRCLVLNTSWCTINQILLISELNDVRDLIFVLLPRIKVCFNLIKLSLQGIDVSITLLDHADDGIKFGFLPGGKIL